MSRKTTAIATALSALVCGSPLLSGCAHFNKQIALTSGQEKYTSGDYQGAIADYDKVIEIDPKHATAYASRCAANMNLGNQQAAIADCDKAIEINPQSDMAYTNRCAANFNSKNYKAAIADCDKAIEINPQS
ncbi:MAG: tetratricopeptide repeat protein, partial [Prochlorococcus sp.]